MYILCQMKINFLPLINNLFASFILPRAFALSHTSLALFFSFWVRNQTYFTQGLVLAGSAYTTELIPGPSSPAFNYFLFCVSVK